ncbi:MAG: hemerythrin domain-containing protein [Deltaproteobacteria bacterium]|nr:hemerythrin domain-containing protein [Deltaproteobacteria bacterium]
MRPTDNFRRQHKDLVDVAGDIEAQLAPEQLVDGTPMRRLLGRFAGKLMMHAAMEEEALYPRLMVHERDDVREVATRLHGELGGIYTDVGDFVQRWRATGAIEAAPVVFVAEIKRVFTMLRKRLEQEETLLYPVADAL